MKIYSILGEEIVTLVNESLNAGVYEVNWDASAYPSGIYVCKISAGKFNNNIKMSLIK
jgi:hypothetical protein